MHEIVLKPATKGGTAGLERCEDVLVVLHDPFNSVPWAEYEAPPGRYLVRSTTHDSASKLNGPQLGSAWSNPKRAAAAPSRAPPTITDWKEYPSLLGSTRHSFAAALSIGGGHGGGGHGGGRASQRRPAKHEGGLGGRRPIGHAHSMDGLPSVAAPFHAPPHAASAARLCGSYGGVGGGGVGSGGGGDGGVSPVPSRMPSRAQSEPSDLASAGGVFAPSAAGVTVSARSVSGCSAVSGCSGVSGVNGASAASGVSSVAPSARSVGGSSLAGGIGDAGGGDVASDASPAHSHDATPPRTLTPPPRPLTPLTPPTPGTSDAARDLEAYRRQVACGDVSAVLRWLDRLNLSEHASAFQQQVPSLGAAEPNRPPIGPQSAPDVPESTPMRPSEPGVMSPHPMSPA